MLLQNINPLNMTVRNDGRSSHSVVTLKLNTRKIFRLKRVKQVSNASSSPLKDLFPRQSAIRIQLQTREVFLISTDMTKHYRTARH
jgi:hypothetical protein